MTTEEILALPAGRELDHLRPEDCDFIAHARQDVPALLAEVERLNREVAKLELELRFEQRPDWIKEERDEIEAHRRAMEAIIGSAPINPPPPPACPPERPLPPG